MTDLAKLVVKLEAQTAQYMAKLDQANKRLEKFNKSSGSIATSIGVGLERIVSGAAKAFFNMSRDAINTADKLSKMSQSTGITTESLSKLNYAAGISGTSLEGLTTGLRKLQKAQSEAAQGSITAKDAFKQIGVAAANSDGTLKNSEELILEIADKFSMLEDGAAKAALAQELFGKTGSDMIPFLNQGRAGIQALTEEAELLGLVITTEAGKAAEQFNDNLTRIHSVSMGLANQAAQELLPMMTTLTDSFIESAKEGGAMEAAMKGLAAVLKILVTAGVIVVSVFQNIGRAIYGNAMAIAAVARGDLKGAIQEYKDAYNDIKNNVTESLATIEKIWGDHVPKIEDKANKAAEAGKKAFVVIDEKAAQEQAKKAETALDQIKEMEINLRQQVDTFHMSEEAALMYSIAQGELSEKFKEAGEASEPYKEKLIALTEKLVHLKEEAEQLKDFMDKLDDEVKKGIDKNAEVIETELEGLAEAEEQLSDFEKKARENLQDILAGGLEGMLEKGVKEGADGALDAFTDMLKKMAIQAVAAQLAEKIFGTGVSTPQVGGGMSSSGGWMGAAMDWLSGAFGRDSGGRGRRGQAYMIGTGAQPEMFVPDSAGEFIPATAWGGMGKLTQNIFVEGRVDQRSARQMALESARRQRIASMRLG